jgi:hypothetical protein
VLNYTASRWSRPRTLRHPATVSSVCPIEIGRMWLDSNGHAVVRGFMDIVRQQFRQVGIFLREDPVSEKLGMVPLSDGDTFLDVLPWECCGSRVIAEQVNET